MKGFIDIGAHWAEEYFDLTPEIRDNMYWLFFEPQRQVFEELCRRLPLTPKIKCFQLALGNQTGVVEMKTEVANKGQSSSILNPKLHLKLYPSVKFIGKETVRIMKLDDVEYDRSLYDVMHIDVQGYELEVLRGADKSLGNIKEITVEVNRDEIYENCPLEGEIDEFLQLHGFVRTKTHWWHELWGDATYKRYDYGLDSGTKVLGDS